MLHIKFHISHQTSYIRHLSAIFRLQSYEKSRAKQKNMFFFCRDGVSSPFLMAKLLKIPLISAMNGKKFLLMIIKRLF